MEVELKTALAKEIEKLIDKAYAEDRFPMEEESRRVMAENTKLTYANEQLRKENMEIKTGIYAEELRRLLERKLKSLQDIEI